MWYRTKRILTCILGFLYGLTMLGGAQYALALSTYSVASITNDIRSSNGLTVLNYNGQLAQAAQLRAQDILDYDYWSHTSPSGKTMSYFLSAVGYPVYSAGENLSRGWDTDSGVVNAWMASTGHRTAMLNSAYTDIGVGYANGMLGDEYTTIVVAYYASTGPIVVPAPQPAPELAPSPATSTSPSTRVQPTTQQVAEQPAPQPAPEPVPVEAQPSAQTTPAPEKVESEITVSTPSKTETPPQQNVSSADKSAWDTLATLFSYVELLFIERKVSFVLSNA